GFSRRPPPGPGPPAPPGVALVLHSGLRQRLHRKTIRPPRSIDDTEVAPQFIEEIDVSEIVLERAPGEFRRPTTVTAPMRPVVRAFCEARGPIRIRAAQSER